MLKVVLPGLMSAISFSIEALLIRYTANMNVSGLDGGFTSVLFNGLYSCVILIFVIAFYPIPLASFLYLVLAGFCTAFAIVCVNIAVVQGEAGIAFSIGNSFPCWHSIYNSTVIGQPLSSG